MDWAALKTLMLHEPKPSMSFVISRHDPTKTRSARVLHDGDSKWLIWSSEKLEINDGRQVVIVSDGKIDVHPPTRSRSVYGHGWIKSMVHPRLTNIADEDDLVVGPNVRAVSTAGIDCWQAEISGLREGEPTVFTVDIEKISGSIVRLRHQAVNAHLDVEELRIGVSIAHEVFEWAAQFRSDGKQGS